MSIEEQNLSLDNVDNTDTVDNTDNVDTVDTVDTVDNTDNTDNVDTAYEIEDFGAYDDEDNKIEGLDLSDLIDNSTSTKVDTKVDIDNNTQATQATQATSDINNLISQEFEFLDNEQVKELTSKVILPIISQLEAKFNNSYNNITDTINNLNTNTQQVFKENFLNKNIKSLEQELGLKKLNKDLLKIINSNKFTEQIKLKKVPGTNLTYSQAIAHAIDKNNSKNFKLLIKSLIVKNTKKVNAEVDNNNYNFSFNKNKTANKNNLSEIETKYKMGKINTNEYKVLAQQELLNHFVNNLSKK